MFNSFTRQRIAILPDGRRILDSALGCCVARAARGIYAVFQLCEADEHRMFHSFIDDERWLQTVAAGRRPDASVQDKAKAQLAWHRARLVLRRPPAGAVVSHVSAAVLHGLPIISAVPELLEYSGPISRRTAHIRMHRPPREAAEVSSVLGRPVTSPWATVRDLAADAGLAAAITAADHLLRGRSIITPDHSPAVVEVYSQPVSERLRAAHAQASRCRSSAAAKRYVKVLRLARGLSESPAESLAIAVLDVLGLTGAYRQQVRLLNREGQEIARVDFLIGRIVVEVDGWSKYPAEDRAAALHAFRAEKRREDAIRALGYTVVRLEWADLIDPARTAAKLRAAGVRV
ncbi:hypothetical protein [Sediminivirga luteola]|uniref:DUF559 domain-containing protein n=1 Tax=Sediminivirga luteola TaxID=1774748 RepID=A0A8J2XJI7_9MICO|nr:hypothetical protein [Sediminivirga luteola]MCI2264741.1 endonuclease domain-containing protein [Sediminivirga luteola]GGA02076.1 hypothetical protein GCM10011333_00750 [Sediminivirga luteola]